MANFDWKAAIQSRPSFLQRDQYYGTYNYAEAGGGWVTPSAAWEQANLTYIYLKDLPGFPHLYGVPNPQFTKIRIHKKVAPIFKATWDDIYSLGLHRGLQSFDGCYAPRHMQNNTRLALSNHAKATAIDFNAATNRMGIPHSAMGMNKILPFVVAMESRGWAWGGRWSTSDGMHFEWVDQDPRCTPPHQDSIISAVPKTSSNPRIEILPQALDVEMVIINGVVQPYEVDKISKVGSKLYIKTKKV